MQQHPTLHDSDETIHDNLSRDLDYHEIRGCEASIIQDWFALALQIESKLNLYRKGMMSVIGIQDMPDGTLEPRFKNNLVALGVELISDPAPPTMEKELTDLDDVGA